MRKVIVSEIVSLDGHFSGPGGNVMVMPFDAGFSENNAELLRGASTLLLGGTSYRGFVDYWPGIKDDADQPELEREISTLNSAMEKVVVSDTLTSDETGPWADSTRIVPRAEAHEVVRALRAEEDGGDIVIFGSHVLWNDLLAHGLVDELHLMFGPGIVGAGGVPAFEAAGPARFRLLDTHRWEGSDLVRLRYAVNPEA
ncbi:deaminase [Knoellia sinensis KCTC 19936]|uniref:Deaminase n=1 Tax=Knoellia sinensis KCTC 19936 TaxID=1385520 RepID=A0A0A0JCH5_9MICO|nr:dihydrofolate reductase family protein [Knoellia sinensis]KGN33717.1 deaminase [Knoellia sinensis KCTC 19936]